MSRFDLVIFDCDGVLIDSETVALPLLGSMISELGVELDVGEVHRRFGGLSLEQVMARVEETLGEGPPPTFLDEFVRRSEETLRRELVPIEGVPELLEGLALPFCSASNADGHELRFNLEVAGLLHHFDDRLFSADDVEHPKPAPDLYLLAARTMGFDPAQCAVVEDTPTGVAAGSAAGMHVFGYASRNSSDQLLAAGARETFRSMAQLSALFG